VLLSRVMHGSNQTYHSVTLWAQRASALFFGASIPLLIGGRGLFFALIGLGGLFGLATILPRVKQTAADLGRSACSFTGIAFALLYVCWAIAALQTIDLQGSSLLFGLVVGVLLLGCLLHAGFANDPNGRELAMRSMIFMAWVAALTIFVGAFIWLDIFETLRQQPVDNKDGVFLILKPYGAVVPILSIVILWAGWRLGRLWCTAAVAYLPVGFMIVYLVENKSAVLAYLGAGIATVLCWWFARLSSREAWVAGIVLVASIILSLILVFSNLPEMPYTMSSHPTLPTWMVDAHRQIIWSFVLDAADERPWFGWGLGTSGRLPGAKEVIPGLTVEYVPSHPHNWVIQVAAESGWSAVGAMALVIVLIARRIILLQNRRHPGAMAAGSVLGAFLASSLVNFSFFAAWWLLIFVLAMALPLSDAESERSAS